MQDKLKERADAVWAWAAMYAVATKTCENRAQESDIYIFFFFFLHYLNCPVRVPTAAKNASYEGMQKQIPKL